MLSQDNYEYLKQKLEEVATKHGERVLVTPKNPISIGLCYFTKTQSRDVSHSSLSHTAVSLSSLPHKEVNWTEFGSMLFTKCVSGTRLDF